MKINRRVTDDLTIELDLSGHALQTLQMALEDGYQVQPMIKCDVCQNEIPVGEREDIVSMGQPMIIEGFPRAVECPQCEGDPYNNSPNHQCDFCRDRGKVDVCRDCHNKWLKGEL